MSKFGEPTPCKNGCGKFIYFDRDSANGHPSADKWVPLEYNNDAGIRTDQPHQCPNKGKGTTTSTSNSKVETSETIFQLLKDIDGKLNSTYFPSHLQDYFEGIKELKDFSVIPDLKLFRFL